MPDPIVSRADEREMSDPAIGAALLAALRALKEARADRGARGPIGNDDDTRDEEVA